MRSLRKDVCRLELSCPSSTYSVSPPQLFAACWSKLIKYSTGKRPYVCKVPGCTRSFARKVTYGKHYRTSHPDQPPLSSDLAKPTVPMPFYAVQRPSSTIRQPGPPGADGKPQYWIPTPADTDDSAPHADAALYPSEGAAYHAGGKHGRRGARGGRAGRLGSGVGVGVGVGDAGAAATGRAKKRSQQHRPPSIITTITSEDKDGGHDHDNDNTVAVDAGEHGQGEGESKPYVSPDQTEQTASLGTPISSSASELFEIHSAFGSCRTPDSATYSGDGGRGGGIDKQQQDPTWTGGSSISTVGTATTPSSLGTGIRYSHDPGPLLSSVPLTSIPEGGASPLDLGPAQHPHPMGRLDHGHSQSTTPTAPIPTYVPNAFTGYLSSRPASLPRQPRAASNPESFGGGVGGGFSSSQVSMPPGMLQLQPIDTRGDRAVSAPMSSQATRVPTPTPTPEHGHDADSGFNGLSSASAGAVPSFAFHEAEYTAEPLLPSFPTINTTYDTSPTQYLGTPSPATRQHQTMPQLTRWKSSPNVSTTSSWNNTPASATSSHFSNMTPHLSPGAESGSQWVNGDSSVMQHQQQQQQMTPIVPSPVIYTPATSASAHMPSLFTTEPLRAPVSASGSASSHAPSSMWSQTQSQAHAYPQPQAQQQYSATQYQSTTAVYPTNPPHPHILHANPFSRSHSTSTSSVGGGYATPSPNTCLPQLTFVPYHPTHFAPVSATAPTLNPLWQAYRHVSQPGSALGSPVILSTASSNVSSGFGPNFLPLPRAVSDASTNSNGNSEHNVYLGTPTPPPPHQHSAAVEHVGLGISNVHFDHPARCVVPSELSLSSIHQTDLCAADKMMEIYEEGEGEPELDSLDEYIIDHPDSSDEDEGGQDDGSDDEFIPGRKAKSAAGKKKGGAGGAKMGHKKRGSIRTIRKVK